MKKWKNIISLKSMLMGLGMIILVTIVTFTATSMIQTTKSAREILEQQRFVFVQDPSYKTPQKNYGKGFDLKSESYFDPSNTAIKGNKVYSSYTNEVAKPLYDRLKYYEFSSALLNSDITTDDIRKSNYRLVLDVESVVNKKLLNQEYEPDLELIYRLKKFEFTKIRITYNKNFLPTKIEWYYKDEQGLKWYTWRTYSYPFKNQEEFNKRLDEEIYWIKGIIKEESEDY